MHPFFMTSFDFKLLTTHYQHHKKTRVFLPFHPSAEADALTPVLRSGYPPCAAVSLVVLSPTNEGRVCDIQLVIIAMVLSTTPIFNSGTVMFGLRSDFYPALPLVLGRFHSAHSSEEQTSRWRIMLPEAPRCFTQGSGLAAFFLDIFTTRRHECDRNQETQEEGPAG